MDAAIRQGVVRHGDVLHEKREHDEGELGLVNFELQRIVPNRIQTCPSPLSYGKKMFVRYEANSE